MFTLSGNKVLDSYGNVVGQVKEGKFSQNLCSAHYANGLTAMELERISETIQRSVPRNRRREHENFNSKR